MSWRSNRIRVVENVKPKIHQRWYAQALLALWRWSPELVVTAGLVIVFVWLVRQDWQPWVAAIVVVVPLAALMSIPAVRAVFWMNITRHRLRAFMSENGLRNRSGRLPWLLFIRPTRVGERAWMVLVAGITVHDVQERQRSLAPSCYAKEGRISPTRRFSHIIRLDIIRRDPFASAEPVRNQLIDNHTELELRPAPSVDSRTSFRASQWAVGIGLPLGNQTETSEEPQPVAKTEKTETVKPIKKAVPPPREDTTPVVIGVNGEDISDYV
jgi:hypothetical protein